MKLGQIPAALLTTTLAAQPGCATLQQALPWTVDLASGDAATEIVLDPQDIEAAPALLPRTVWSEDLPIAEIPRALGDLEARCDFVLFRPEHVHVIGKTEIGFHIEFFRARVRCSVGAENGVFVVTAGPVEGEERALAGTHQSLVINKNSLVAELGEQAYEKGEIAGPIQVVRVQAGREGEQALFLGLTETMQQVTDDLGVFFEKWQQTCGSEDIIPPFTLETDEEWLDDVHCLKP